MKSLIAFAATFLLFVNFGHAQDWKSFNIQDNIDLGIPIEPFSTYGYGLNKKSSKNSPEIQFEDIELLKKPVFYTLDPTLKLFKNKRNPMPQLNFSLLIAPLPYIEGKMPLKELDLSGNPTLLINPLF